MQIRIEEVITKRQLRQFVCFPRHLYRHDPNFVFEPIVMQMEFLSGKNPFFEHSSARYFLAVSGGRVVGRIASIVNTVHNAMNGTRTGFFGFLEAEEHDEIMEKLLDVMVETHRRKGFDRITGPVNFTTNDSCGMLISGFDDPPVIMMPYNKPYYNDYLIRYGFEKEIDLSSYYIGDHVLKDAAFLRLTARLRKNLDTAGITIRAINYRRLKDEIGPFRKVYNQSNAENWGFVPLNEREFSHTAHQFRQFVPEKCILIAEKEARQIGFVVALPDLNQVFSHIRSGKLWPFGFLRYFWYRKKIRRSRILILGILKEYRNKGIDAVLYKLIQENLATIGITHGEACYVMENNTGMHSIMKKLGGSRIKQYRIYRYYIIKKGEGERN